ncbi:non-specific lipid-transfer protein 2 [Tanacetum coccineum]
MKLLAIFALMLLVAGHCVGDTTTPPTPSVEVACSPSQLTPCLRPILKGTPPPDKCCSKLKEQKSCLCGYIKDPAMAKYVNSPGAKKVAKTCGVPIPNCK